MSSDRLFRVTTLAVLLASALGCVAAIGNRGGAPKTTSSQTDRVGDYRIETIRLDDGTWSLLKYRPDTGQAWYSVAPDNAVWIPIHDTQPVPGSSYVFKPRTTGGPGWSIIRLDTRTGRTWITRNSVWVEVVDEPDEKGTS